MNLYLRIGSTKEADIRCPEVNERPVNLHIRYTRGEYVLAYAPHDFTPVKINGRNVALPYQLAARDVIQLGSHKVYWANYREVGEEQELYYSDLTTWRGRLSRSNFRALSLLSIGLVIIWPFVAPHIVGLFFPEFVRDQMTATQLDAIWSVYLPIVLLIGYFVLLGLYTMFAVKRIRDTGHPAWKVLIPGYNLKLLFMEPGKVYGGRRLVNSPN